MDRPPFQSPKGTFDILPDAQRLWRLFHDKAEEVATAFGYEPIDTPTFEDAGLYVRGIGEVTDVVEKETYTFEDRGGDLLTLRPEGTAGVCRAYLQHGMHNLPQPVRLYYAANLFRYERPQAGRFREHHQFGIEVLGDGDPAIDVEVIEVAWRLLEALGIGELSLVVNSTGDRQCRAEYVRELQSYYRPHVERICANCRRRLEHNPLRLLDCKEDSCQPVIAGAPASIDFLCEPCAEHWEQLVVYLGVLGLPFEIDKRLVRGFDYYTRTVFEIVPPRQGRTSTIAGGGRYDGLIEELGGRPTPGIGFGMGVERVLDEIRRRDLPLAAEDAIRVLVAHVGDQAKEAGLSLASDLRRAGMAAVLAPVGRSLRAQLRYASVVRATHAVILGESELAQGTAILRDLAKSDQREVARERLIPELMGGRV